VNLRRGYAAARVYQNHFWLSVGVATTPSNVRLSIRVIDECSFRALPAIHPSYFEVRAGALMSYGPTMLENYVGAARYVDLLLKGAKISDLPIQEPTEIRLASIWEPPARSN
jgi:hypothetical protein